MPLETGRFYEDQSPQELTRYHFVNVEFKVDVWIDVPFTQEELDAMQRARQLISSQSIRDGAFIGSTHERESYMQVIKSLMGMH